MEVEGAAHFGGDAAHAVEQDLTGVLHDRGIALDRLDRGLDADVGQPAVSVSEGQRAALAVELAERSALTLGHAHGWLAHVGVEAPVESIEGDPAIVEHTRQVLLDGVRRIAAEVRSSLDFHRMNDDAASVTRAVMTGPATAIPGFDVALASELGMPVEEGTVDGAPAGLEAGRVTIAAGLAVEEAPA